MILRMRTRNIWILIIIMVLMLLGVLFLSDKISESGLIEPVNDSVVEDIIGQNGNLDKCYVPENGPCKANFKRYFFDTSEDKCKEFSGCYPLIFETLEECKDSCELRFEPPVCGNGICESGEDENNCLEDCE